MDHELSFLLAHIKFSAIFCKVFVIFLLSYYTFSLQGTSHIESDSPKSDSYISPSDHYDSDDDPPFGICHVRSCSQEVFAACHLCDFLLCYDHFMEDVPTCKYHGKGVSSLIYIQTNKKHEIPLTAVSQMSNKEVVEQTQNYFNSKESEGQMQGDQKSFPWKVLRKR